MCCGVRQTRTPHLPFLQHHQTKSTSRPSMRRIPQKGQTPFPCPVGLLLKAASVRAGIGTPMEPSHGALPPPKNLLCDPSRLSPPISGCGAPAEFLLLARQLSRGWLEWGCLLQPRVCDAGISPHCGSNIKNQLSLILPRQKSWARFQLV